MTYWSRHRSSIYSLTFMSITHSACARPPSANLRMMIFSPPRKATPQCHGYLPLNTMAGTRAKLSTRHTACHRARSFSPLLSWPQNTPPARSSAILATCSYDGMSQSMADDIADFKAMFLGAADIFFLGFRSSIPAYMHWRHISLDFTPPCKGREKDAVYVTATFRATTRRPGLPSRLHAKAVIASRSMSISASQKKPRTQFYTSARYFDDFAGADGMPMRGQQDAMPGCRRLRWPLLGAKFLELLSAGTRSAFSRPPSASDKAMHEDAEARAAE